MIAPMSLAVQVPVDSTDAPVDSVTASPGETQIERITKFTIGGGGGRFYREIFFPSNAECDVPVPFKHDFNDFAADIDVQTGDRAHFGIRGGFVTGDIELAGAIDTTVVFQGDEPDLETYYANPYFSYERARFGFGVGVLISTNPLAFEERDALDYHSGEYELEENTSVYPTAHLRFGDLSRFYASAHLFESVPIYSGGGIGVAGVGFRPVRWLELYAGYASSNPYAEDTALGRVTVDITRNWTFMTMFRIPDEYDEVPDNEYGVSVGLSYRHYR